ncbi:MAG: rRNA methyltransferase [Helicobacteraceae bacterium CG2_30_36_10]|nr:MAG: rRNA methyltransferase [Helicobacteraceae bacterium CG2_30_36_10]
MFKLITVESIYMPELAIYQQLRDNVFDKENSFVADSPKVVNMLLSTEIEVKSILATKEYYEEFGELIASKNIAKLFVCDKKEMETIIGHKLHHNCMMHGVRPPETPLDKLGNHILMLDVISSTENIGSIARSAAALGVDSYLVPKAAPHPYGRRALRVSMGHVSKLKINIYNDIFQTLQTLQANGYTVLGAEVSVESIALTEVKVPKKWVLLMGNEGAGLSKEVQDACDTLVQIEMMPDVRSFNVAIAASILMHHFKNNIK